MRTRISKALVDLTTGERRGLKAELVQETTELGIINRVSFNQLTATGASEHVTITTFTDGTVQL